MQDSGPAQDATTAPAGGIREAAVFCGSRFGNRPAFRDATVALGRGLARLGIGLIYGGGRIGLMGLLADTVLDSGGRVAGVIPAFLSTREIAHPRVDDLEVTDSMHSRKRRMFDRAEAFVTMPGGLGTLDETVEIVTWRQLGLHDKPILVVDVDGWAASLAAAFEAAIADGFAGAQTRDLYEIVPDVDAALARLASIRPERAGPNASSRL